MIKKSSLLIILLASLSMVSCKKDLYILNLEDFPYELRIAGLWDLEEVSFKTELPNPQNPLQTIEIEGDGTEVKGTMLLGHDPNSLSLVYDFVANISLADSLPAIPFPVEMETTGTWSATSDESRIFVTGDDQTAYTFVVLTNEANRQIYETTVEETILGAFTIKIDILLTFTR